uniref:Expressed protein n=1 Tax=Echinococcus granulosus TaxID=6210 RepID=A0A068X1D9_ECHGR|nr:expressed protein [Echinococcus granulosus]
MSDLEDRLPFFETMRHWTDEDGQPLFEDCGVLCGSGRISLTMANFRIYLDVYTEAPDWESTHLHLWPMALKRYDGFVYLVNSTMHCHVRHRLPYYLKRLMQDTTKIVCDGKRPLPALLILDLVIGQTCGDADSLATNLHALDDGILGGFTRLPARFWSCNWWRVWRLQQEDGKYVNLYEAFQWAALQLARNGTRKGKILHYSNVPAPSFIRWFE